MRKKQEQQENPNPINRIEQVRREIMEWKAERRKVAKIAGLIDAALAESDRRIDAMGEKYFTQRPAPNSLCAYLSAPAPDSLADPTPLLQLLAALPTTNKELKAVARRRIETTWPAETMSETDKAAKLRAIDEKLFNLEMREEHLILDLEKLGGQINRRPDLNPAVFLQVEFE